MGKYAKDKRKYRKEWESSDWAKGWLQHVSLAKHAVNDVNEAYCKFCKTTLRSHISDLKKHAESEKHKSKASAYDTKQKNTLLNYGCIPISEEKKVTDITLALYVAMHSSILSIDHLGEILKKVGKGSNIENLRLHRTKCSSLIQHVIAPVLLTNLLEAIGDNGYSIIIDESTDVSVTKYLCICIKYFNIVENRIITDFLTILEVDSATADNLFQIISEYFIKIGLPLKNMIAIGTDGANNLCGKNHSLYTLLKKEIPNLTLMKCSCHSLHLCAMKASEELPSSLNFLASEIYNWFSVSSLRRIKYRNTFNMINIGIDSKKFRQLIQLSKTRWLCFYEVVKRLLEQWVELSCHFEIACDAEHCYTARTIRDMLKDESNKLYFIFLKPILSEIQHLNLSFQSETVDIGSMYTEIFLTFLSFSKRILKPSFLIKTANKSLMNQVIDALNNNLAILPIDAVDFGIDFINAMAESKISTDSKVVLKQRCFNFLRKLLIEMAQRLPTNMEIFKNNKAFSPAACLSHIQEKFTNLPLKPFMRSECDLSIYECQWQKLPFVDWKTHFEHKIPNNILNFWPEVYRFNDASGRFIFKELAEAVLKMLCIPTSNAVVERAFSALTLIKTRNRNKLRTDMLQALMRIRIHCNNHSNCCKVFKPSKDMINKFNSNTMYNTVKDENDKDDIEETNNAFEIMEEVF